VGCSHDAPTVTDVPEPLPPPIPAQLVFATQPPQSVAASEALGEIRISLLSKDGRVAAGIFTRVTMTLQASDTSAKLIGTTTAETTTGIATFSDLYVLRAGSGFRLVAHLSETDSAVSLPFTIRPNVASQLHFRPLPQRELLAGQEIPGVVVETVDVGGNFVPADGSVSLSYTRLEDSLPFTAAPDGIFGSTTTATLVNGVAVFPGLYFQKNGGYYLLAEAKGFVGAKSGFLSIRSTFMERLMFIPQPANGVAGAPLSPFSVRLVDKYGNGRDRPSLAQMDVTVMFGKNPSGATLSGTLTETNYSIMSVDFRNVSIDRPGTGYTLIATTTATSGAAPIASAESAPFDIR
jgi:hypothetical protein